MLAAALREVDLDSRSDSGVLTTNKNEVLGGFGFCGPSWRLVKCANSTLESVSWFAMNALRLCFAGWLARMVSSEEMMPMVSDEPEGWKVNPES